METGSVIQVWTIQPETVWRKLERRGRLTVDRRYNHNLHESYEWLVAQLCRRVPGYRGHYPWWAYGARPDLRRVRHEKAGGRTRFLIELELPREQVAVFPAWAWDDIFYGRFLSPSRRVADAWERRLREAVPDADDLLHWPEPWTAELHASWESLFDLRLPSRERRRSKSGAFEAVFEVLDMTRVRSVRPFSGARQDAPLCGPANSLATCG